MKILGSPTVLLTLMVLSLGLIDASGILPRQNAALPNFDRRLVEPAKEPPIRPEKHRAHARLQNHAPEAKVTWDPVLGTPRWIHVPASYLSGPNGQGKAISPETARAFPVNDPHRAVKAFLKDHAALFGHGPEVLDKARVAREFTAKHNGLRTVVWEQEWDQIPVFEGLFVAHTSKDGELTSVSSRFVPDPEQAASRGNPKRAQLQANPNISAEQAILSAATNIQERLALEEIVPAKPRTAGRAGTKTFSTRKVLAGETEARLVWLPLDPKQMRLCWEVILTSRARGETFRVLVDAETGEAMLRHCLTDYATPAAYRVFTRESPTPFAPGHPAPSTTQPPAVERELVTWMAFDANASPNGWIGLDMETRGNNVDAYLDWNADNQPDAARPNGGPQQLFDFPLDLNLSPNTYSNASVVQLFYWCNWMHDRLYQLGFDEAAGNFQQDNFGRGGWGNDAVLAEAQDGAGGNNANMTTLPDGYPPRMQMFLWTGCSPDRDGSLDAEIVLHEYTHGLSNRRVGGGIGLTALQSQGLGEGWSDFYALALLRQSGDDPNETYACGAYVGYLLSGLRENYYFGIRRYPYSTDLTKNPLTFKDIDSRQASSHADIPRNAVFSRIAAEDPHAQGEVWCVTLWEARANLIQKHGPERGNQLILQLVTDAMNLTPANPNFLEARDALIQADFINNGGANFDELWRAFAKRGLGYSATAPASSTTEGVVEAFDLPDTLWISPSGGWSSLGLVGGPFEPATQAVLLTNLGTNLLEWRAAVSESWLGLSSSSGMLPPGEQGTAVTAFISGWANYLPAGLYTNVLTFTNVTTGRSQSRSIILSVGGRDYFTESFARGDNDLRYLTLTFTPDGSSNYYSVCRAVATSFPTDPFGGTDLALGDDKYQKLLLSGESQVQLYGRATNVIYIGSNGYITWDAGDTYMVGTLPKHFRLPRIAGLFADLEPCGGGRVSWLQLDDRVAVTFENVPEYGISNSNNFQIEMFTNGQIRLTYLDIQARGGLAGLSDGKGVPAVFFGSDLSRSQPCVGRVGLRVPREASEGDGLLAGQGEVSLPEAPAEDVVVALSASDPTEVFVPGAVVIRGGTTNATFDVQVLEDADWDGTQLVTIRAATTQFGDAHGVLLVYDNESATPQPVQVARSGTQVILQWAATSNGVYRVEYKNDLAENTWISLQGQFSLSEGIATAQDVVEPGRQRFYRVQRVR